MLLRVKRMYRRGKKEERVVRTNTASETPKKEDVVEVIVNVFDSYSPSSCDSSSSSSDSSSSSGCD